MKSTTVKVSVETRERLRAAGNGTYEETILEALDLLEMKRFWRQAEDAAEWRRHASPEQLARLEAREREIDAAFDGVG